MSVAVRKRRRLSKLKEKERENHMLKRTGVAAETKGVKTQQKILMPPLLLGVVAICLFLSIVGTDVAAVHRASAQASSASSSWDANCSATVRSNCTASMVVYAYGAKGTQFQINFNQILAPFVEVEMVGGAQQQQQLNKCTFHPPKEWGLHSQSDDKDPYSASHACDKYAESCDWADLPPSSVHFTHFGTDRGELFAGWSQAGKAIEDVDPYHDDVDAHRSHPENVFTFKQQTYQVPISIGEIPLGRGDNVNQTQARGPSNITDRNVTSGNRKYRDGSPFECFQVAFMCNPTLEHVATAFLRGLTLCVNIYNSPPTVVSLPYYLDQRTTPPGSSSPTSTTYNLQPLESYDPDSAAVASDYSYRHSKAGEGDISSILFNRSAVFKEVDVVVVPPSPSSSTVVVVADPLNRSGFIEGTSVLPRLRLINKKQASSSSTTKEEQLIRFMEAYYLSNDTSGEMSNRARVRLAVASVGNRAATPLPLWSRWPPLSQGERPLLFSTLHVIPNTVEEGKLATSSSPPTPTTVVITPRYFWKEIEWRRKPLGAIDSTLDAMCGSTNTISAKRRDNKTRDDTLRDTYDQNVDFLYWGAPRDFSQYCTIVSFAKGSVEPTIEADAIIVEATVPRAAGATKETLPSPISLFGKIIIQPTCSRTGRTTRGKISARNPQLESCDGCAIKFVRFALPLGLTARLSVRRVMKAIGGELTLEPFERKRTDRITVDSIQPLVTWVVDDADPTQPLCLMDVVLGRCLVTGDIIRHESDLVIGINSTDTLHLLEAFLHKLQQAQVEQTANLPTLFTPTEVNWDAALNMSARVRAYTGWDTSIARWWDPNAKTAPPFKVDGASKLYSCVRRIRVVRWSPPVDPFLAPGLLLSAHRHRRRRCVVRFTQREAREGIVFSPFACLHTGDDVGIRRTDNHDRRVVRQLDDTVPQPGTVTTMRKALGAMINWTFVPSPATSQKAVFLFSVFRQGYRAYPVSPLISLTSTRKPSRRLKGKSLLRKMFDIPLAINRPSDYPNHLKWPHVLDEPILKEELQFTLSARGLLMYRPSFSSHDKFQREVLSFTNNATGSLIEIELMRMSNSAPTLQRELSLVSCQKETETGIHEHARVKEGREVSGDSSWEQMTIEYDDRLEIAFRAFDRDGDDVTVHARQLPTLGFLEHPALVAAGRSNGGCLRFVYVSPSDRDGTRKDRVYDDVVFAANDGSDAFSEEVRIRIELRTYNRVLRNIKKSSSHKSSWLIVGAIVGGLIVLYKVQRRHRRKNMRRTALPTTEDDGNEPHDSVAVEEN